jgi:type IV pilus biogenesis protein CpaD/CtpE
MTSIVTASLALAVAALAAGCAADAQTAPGNEPMAPREYRTGSNIAVREPRSTSPEEKARAAPPADAGPAAAPVKPTN